MIKDSWIKKEEYPSEYWTYSPSENMMLEDKVFPVEQIILVHLDRKRKNIFPYVSFYNEIRNHQPKHLDNYLQLQVLYFAPSGSGRFISGEEIAGSMFMRSQTKDKILSLNIDNNLKNTFSQLPDKEVRSLVSDIFRASDAKSEDEVKRITGIELEKLILRYHSNEKELKNIRQDYSNFSLRNPEHKKKFLIRTYEQVTGSYFS